MIAKHRFPILLLLSGCLMSTSGCVYYRLFKLKQQLGHFPEHFKVVQKGERPTLVFLNPVVEPGDIVWLIGLEPSTETPIDRGVEWVYDFRKMLPGRVDRKKEDDLDVIMLFQEGLLKRISFPARYADFMTSENFDEIFGPMNGAAIQKIKQKTQWSFREINIQIPKLEEILYYMGSPSSRTESDNRITLVNKYRLQPEKTQEDISAEVRMRFDVLSEGGLLVLTDIYVGRLHVRVDLSKEENRVQIKRRSRDAN